VRWWGIDVTKVMMKPSLTQVDLLAAAETFCQGQHIHAELFGVNDGKAVGTFIEHRFLTRIAAAYEVQGGNSALGLDIPSIDTDIKVTSIRQPQSSCPFRSARQKVYGLGYHLLLFVYEKRDDPIQKAPSSNSCIVLSLMRDVLLIYQTTRGILELLARDGNRDDLLAFLSDRNLPGDEIVHNALADEIMHTPPLLGYLTISNALQWRLQYSRVVTLADSVEGVVKVV
jgi:hypothetical protein